MSRRSQPKAKTQAGGLVEWLQLQPTVPSDDQMHEFVTNYMKGFPLESRGSADPLHDIMSIMQMYRDLQTQTPPVTEQSLPTTPCDRFSDWLSKIKNDKGLSDWLIKIKSDIRLSGAACKQVVYHDFENPAAYYDHDMECFMPTHRAPQPQTPPVTE